MKRAFFIFVLLWIVQAIAGTRNPVLISEDLFKNKENRLQLESVWKYHPGDNVEWASPQYDDSDWESQANSILYGKYLPKSDWDGIGWFRTTIKPDSQLVNKSLAIMMNQACASEIYLDGKLLFSEGVIGNTAEEETCRITFETMTLFPIVFPDTGEYQLAVRYSFKGYKNVAKEMVAYGFFLSFSEYNRAYEHILERINMYSGLRMFFTAIPFILAILHFLLFAFYPRSRENLYYSIFCVGAAMLTFSILGAWMHTSGTLFMWHIFFFKVSLLVIYISGLLFLYSIFYSRLPLWFWPFMVTALILLASSWWLGFGWMYGFGIVVMIAQIYIVIFAIKNKKPGAWLIFSGFLIFAIACTYQMLSAFGMVPMLSGFFQFPYLYGFTGMMLCMSIYLARNFAQTQLTLEKVNVNQIHTIQKLEDEVKERKKAEELSRQQQEKLIQADKMASVGILVSGVAHEINNPNNYMLLNSNNLSDVWKEMKPILDSYCEEKGDFMIAGLPYTDLRDEIGSLISGISEGSERIRMIVQSLKDFARQDPGAMNQQVSVNSVIKSSVIILANMIKKSTDYFTTDFDENIPMVKGNNQQIEQVVINLISNSCQALPDKNCELTVRTSYDNEAGKVNVLVEDKGKGIKPEDMTHIMDPFFTTKRDTGGTGLGLSISFNIIKEHGGELVFHSEEGKGTKALIILPVIKGSEADA
ncbi:MAG: hypothetical protein HQK83_07820 [Fibrobacteria bacterium]|nr:hypothetical protein [Fibrobacteria bacterium]